MHIHLVFSDDDRIYHTVDTRETCCAKYCDFGNKCIHGTRIRTYNVNRNDKSRRISHNNPST